MKQSFTAVLMVLLLFLSACGASPADEDPPVPPELPSVEVPDVPEPPPPPPPPTEEELAAERIESLLNSMTLEEKAGQLFFVQCPGTRVLEDVTAYHLGGCFLFIRDFKDASGNWLTAEQVAEKFQAYQDAAAIPLLIGADEEGGEVARASWSPKLFPGGRCRSPQWLWEHRSEDSDVFAEDAWEKNSTLLALGINVNLSPVCDVSTDPGSFIYSRTLGQDAVAMEDYVRRVVTAMRECGIGSVLKHFPGYGNNVDTHTGIALDDRPMEVFLESDFLPFRAGLQAGGETTAVLVSHNIVACMDPDLPASLSPAVHEILRRELAFDGVVMTDDLSMRAVAAYAKDGAVAVMALAAGNDLVVTADYRTQIPKVIEAVESGELPEEILNNACRRVLTWKQTLGLIE